jgi:nitrite reductase (NADH) small subunit
VAEAAAEWVQVGALASIPRLGARVVRTPRGDIAVFRTAGDEVFALDDRCPHRNGPLSQGIVHGRRVTCPLHNWVIALDSGEAVAPDRGCAHRHDVQVVEGMILMRTRRRAEIAIA